MTIPAMAAFWGGVLWIFAKVMSEASNGSVSLVEAMIYFGWIVLYFGGFIAFFGLTVALPVLIYAEMRSIRSVAFYCLAAALIAVFGYLSYGAWLGFPDKFLGSANSFVLLACAGALSGLVYWRIAGHNAGGRQTVASA
jgi:hypothetical protein